MGGVRAGLRGLEWRVAMRSRGEGEGGEWKQVGRGDGGSRGCTSSGWYRRHPGEVSTAPPELPPTRLHQAPPLPWLSPCTLPRSRAPAEPAASGPPRWRRHPRPHLGADGPGPRPPSQTPGWAPCPSGPARTARCCPQSSVGPPGRPRDTPAPGAHAAPSRVSAAPPRARAPAASGRWARVLSWQELRAAAAPALLEARTGRPRDNALCWPGSTLPPPAGSSSVPRAPPAACRC